MSQQASVGEVVRVASPARTVRQRSANGAAYTMLVPWLVGFFGLTAIPMVASLYLSFTDYSLLAPPEWVGADNYAYMFNGDYRFWPSLTVTAFYVFVSVPLATVVALAVAVGLNRKMRGIGILRSVYYLPSLLGGSVAIAIMWRELFDKNGLVNLVLSWFGIDGPAWLALPQTAPWTLVFLHAWQFGAPMVIFLAALKQIPSDLYEAAELDGANRVQVFFTITLPLITPIVFFNVVMQMITSFQAFTPAFVISNGTGAPLDSTLFYTLYLYIEGFGNFRMGYAAALAWVLLAIIAGLTALAFATARFWVFNPDD
ncbi:carbohydrate ABC transporter permease [Devosia nitrariae]|uniref:ABC transporter permease n=1 Tax=Devosia nitrariae TaxID=2071872 RepID=A0ABQ5W7V8_9HYPH|nr:sugar ABC transporter permease [Devosia nitrariae]GLQ55853.1 ABC transporter permease [Devosia nitrariae]